MSFKQAEISGASVPAQLTNAAELRRQILEVVNSTPVFDIHTHLFPREFGELNLSGIDELLTYHYLIAELFRSTDIDFHDFWQMTKAAQADLIWKTLFVENTPISEATRGIITVLSTLGLNPAASDLAEARAYFGAQDPDAHIERMLDLAGVSDVVMTNDPFDPGPEKHFWESGASLNKRFHAALRMDPLLNDWKNTAARLSALGCDVDEGLNEQTVSEIRRFLNKWVVRMRPLYMAVSLPDTFSFPMDDARDRLIRQVVLPMAREHSLPFAVMIGVRRGVNPALRMAGDGMGRADVGAVERLCADNPDVRFLVTFLSRENQHELCVSARKFRNLMPFGCWWFLNNPSIISEITSERIELLGASFIPQHSDARILEQLVYKWSHSRRTIADCLSDAYEKVLESGRAVSRAEIERDVARLFTGNFRDWVHLNPAS